MHCPYRLMLLLCAAGMAFSHGPTSGPARREPGVGSGDSCCVAPTPTHKAATGGRAGAKPQAAVDKGATGGRAKDDTNDSRSEKNAAADRSGENSTGSGADAKTQAAAQIVAIGGRADAKPQAAASPTPHAPRPRPTPQKSAG